MGAVALQVHWAFGPQAVDASVTLANTTLQLLHRTAPPGVYPMLSSGSQQQDACFLLWTWNMQSTDLPHTSTCKPRKASVAMFTVGVCVGRPSQIMETLHGAAATPPAPQSTVNSLTIPAGQQQFTATFACAKRCTFAPLGGLSPRPVSVVGVTLQGGPHVTGVWLCMPVVGFERGGAKRDYAQLQAQHAELPPGDRHRHRQPHFADRFYTLV